MKNGGNGGVSGEMGWVMSPTSYRAAPPRTEVLRIKLHHSPIRVNNFEESIAQYAHTAHSAWGQIWDLNAFSPRPPSQGGHRAGETFGRGVTSADVEPSLYGILPDTHRNSIGVPPSILHPAEAIKTNGSATRLKRGQATHLYTGVRGEKPRVRRASGFLAGAV